MIRKRRCPLSVDGWVEFLSGEIYIGFQYIFGLWLALLTAYMVVIQLQLSIKGFVFCIFVNFLIIFVIIIPEIVRLQGMRRKIINGLKNTNKIRKEWEKLTLIGYLLFI